METGARAILLAEDDPNDVLLEQRACKKAGITSPVLVVKNGGEAKDYLRGEGVYADRTKYQFPCLLVTDLKMPRCGGLDLLKWIRENPMCRVVPTIILSASPNAEHVMTAYELGVNCYLCKPPTFDKLVAHFVWLRRFCEEAMLPEPPKRCL